MTPLVFVPQHFGALLYDRRCGRYYPYDADAAAVLSALCAADVDTVAAAHPAPEQVEDFCDSLAAMDFLTPDGRLAAVAVDAEPPADHLLGPLAVHLEVVGTCNLSCAHCFAAPLPRAPDRLTLAEMDDLFGQMAALGSQRLSLTGGEPFVRRDFIDIIDAATSHGLSPSITTNGLLLTEALARALGARPLLWLNVSLDGATAAVSDAVRGAGTFERVCEKVRMLRRHARFSMAFTLTAANIHQAADCARLARELGAESAVFRPLYPAGAALRRLDLMPSFEGYLSALRAVEGLAIDIDGFGPAQRAARQARVYGNGGCGAGNLICSISAEGQVSPCSYLGPAMEAASIRARSLSDIWSASQTFQAIRALPSGSPGCFSGGCRARSQALHGDLNAPDPWQEAADQMQARSPTLTTGVSA